MNREDVFVEVRTRDLTRVGTITPAYLNLKATVRWSNVGSWELHLPADHPLASVLATPGSGIVVTIRGEVEFSGPTVKPKRVRNQTNPDGTLTFVGVTDEQVLADALAFPSPTIADASAQTTANDTRTAAAETLMRAYVGANITPGVAPAGRIAGLREFLTLGGTDLGRGITVTKSPRFKNLLELLHEVAVLSPDLGFRVVQRGGDLVFEVVESVDRRPFVRFDIENGSVTSETIEQSGPSVTRAIVAGQGEGVDRMIVTRTTAESAAGEFDWGRVVETFIDRRDAEAVGELNQSGDEALLEFGYQATSVKLVPSDDQSMVFGTDWRPGDLVALSVGGLPGESYVSAAAFIVDASGVYVGAALGDVRDFDKDVALVKRVDDIDARTSKLERSEAAGSAPEWADVLGKPLTFPPEAHAHDDRYFTEGEVAALLASLVPAGTITATGRSTAPSGWLICDGSAVSRSTYADLFSAIGTSFGAGDGSTTFQVPDLRGRSPVGRDSTQTEFDSLGESGGSKSHAHSLSDAGRAAITNAAGGLTYFRTIDGGFTATTVQSGNSRSGSSTATTQSTGLQGNTDAASALPPYRVVNYMIKI